MNQNNSSNRHHQIPIQIPTIFTPYQYNKPTEFKPINVQIPNIQKVFIKGSSSNGQGTIKKQVYNGKLLQDKLDSNQISNRKQLYKIEKSTQWASYKDINIYGDDYGGYDTIPIKKQQSQPELRKTFSNARNKIDQNSINSGLRLTSNGQVFAKVQAQIKKNGDEDMKIMKKQGVMGQVLPAPKSERLFKSKVQAKKQILEKSPFKSLNEIASNKVTKPKKTFINGFQIYKQLGKGKFGQVYLARHVETGFIVALKKIIKAKVIQYKMIEQFKRQIRLHSALDHPHIVKFYGFFQDEGNIYLILEYISGGTLFDYLGEKQKLSPKEVAEYLRDTIDALTYMHEKSIAHRDIKPQNIVLTAQKVAKLCDFGWSALVQSSRTTYCGTFDYAPPQILQRKNYDTAVDIWCLGVLTFELLTGRVPFEGQKRKQIMQKILSVDKNKIMYPEEIPQDARSFIEQLVQKDPNLRPKCKNLLKHSFFTNNLKNVPYYPLTKDNKKN